MTSEQTDPGPVEPASAVVPTTQTSTTAAPPLARYIIAENHESTAFADVTRKLAMSRYLRGEQPFACHEQSLPALPPVHALVPLEATVTHYAKVDSRREVLVAVGDVWTVFLNFHLRSKSLEIFVTADSPVAARAVLDSIRQKVRPPEGDRDNVSMMFWYATRHGADNQSRNLEAPPWSAIVGNYPRTVAAALSVLTASPEPTAGGRLILWHGEPGTGKTTAIRSLAREWRGWADAHVVMDAERFFDDPQYMFHVVLNYNWEGNKWHLIIIEDADQFIMSDARARAGPGLGRLLNLTDGMFGQGSKTLLLITTNEPLGRLHPAIARPGRCMANVEFTRFDPESARQWLGRNHPVWASGATLAELYAARDEVSQILGKALPERDGLYL